MKKPIILQTALAAAKRKIVRWRSSITGRFVKRAYAKKHGDTTVAETDDA